MTVQEKIAKYVEALELAESRLEELALDREEFNELLKRWYDHKTVWVTPFDPKRPSRAREPEFVPAWSNFAQESDTSPNLFHFQSWSHDEYDHVYVPVAYMLDPDGWIERDKQKMVTKDTWQAQKQAYLEQMRDEAIEREVEALRAKGYTVEKKY